MPHIFPEKGACDVFLKVAMSFGEQQQLQRSRKEKQGGGGEKKRLKKRLKKKASSGCQIIAVTLINQI
jgi:hypothetical protein